MSRETQNNISYACARFQEKLEFNEDDLHTWTESLDELSEIEQAFEDKLHGNKLRGKTMLDIGTYGVKPLYIALKYEPKRIIGINEEFRSYTADIKTKSKLFVKTEIKFYPCNFFNYVKLEKILTSEKQKRSDFVLLSNTLHHLRTGECIAKERDQENEDSCTERKQKHTCQDDEKSCIYRFEEQKIFQRLLKLGKRVIVYEWFDASKEDDDKVRGRGGYFTIKEWKKILRRLAEKYNVELIQPIRCSIDKEKLENVAMKLRQTDCICFYVEMKDI